MDHSIRHDPEPGYQARMMKIGFFVTSAVLRSWVSQHPAPPERGREDGKKRVMAGLAFF